MFELVDMMDVESIYIASDSTSSQYRNKFNVFLTKDWAVKTKKMYIGSLQNPGMVKVLWTELWPLLRPLLKILSHIFPMKSSVVQGMF